MVKKKLKELRDLSTGELLKMRTDILNNIRGIVFKMKIERPNNLMEKKNLRNKVAVINTLLRERELKEKVKEG